MAVDGAVGGVVEPRAAWRQLPGQPPEAGALPARACGRGAIAVCLKSRSHWQVLPVVPTEA